MANKDKTIIFDSSGLVSLVKTDDQLHEKAVKVAEILAADGWHLLLPYEVLAESLNTLGKLVSKRSAIAVGNTLMEQHTTLELTFIHSEPYLINAALEHLKAATGSPSFVDCVVMACADEHQSKYIFGFDATFRKNGYQIPAA